ncbi:hypothetical protein [Streptomyces sp. NPDC047315]|uniref:hypothetical protein n=1 Tax=Streptomyces sp. NPDC047315 TaxID=3155142 RepID=UPI0033F0B4C3
MSNCSALKTPGYDEPKTLAALEDLLGASTGPSAHIISLHPRLAARLLRRNTVNRNLRPATVADYSATSRPVPGRSTARRSSSTATATATSSTGSTASTRS